MGVTYRYLAVADDAELVADWFTAHREAPLLSPTSKGFSALFNTIGELQRRSDGAIDAMRCPIVNVFAPARKRGILWTAGEIHFLATPLRKQFPKLHAVARELRTWLGEFTIVHPDGAWDYYLEGSIRNFDAEVFAFPSAMERLRAGETYFVTADDTDAVVQRVCQSLALRGLRCEP